MDINSYFVYIVLEEETYVGLQIQVNEHIKEGYKPQGGIAVIGEGRTRRYYQAMTKGLK